MLGTLLVLGSIALGLATGAQPAEIAGYFVTGLSDWQTIQLLGIVTMVEMLSVLLDRTGGLERALHSLRRVAPDVRVLIALVPTLLGPLPVPGGAMLSAPMVGKYGDELGLSPDEKASVNLFFRHVWDLLSPFKPVVIVAAAVLNIPIFTLIGWQAPISALTFAFGYWYLIGRRAPRHAASVPAPVGGSPGTSAWLEVAPLGLPIVLALVLGIDFLYAMGVGLAFGLISKRASSELLRVMVRDGVDVRMLYTLASVMVFKTAVEQTDVMTGLTDLLAANGVPFLTLVILLPFVIGHAVGMEMPAVALVFPLVLGMLPAGSPVLPHAIVMLTANAVGSILSPVHVCVVVGNSYYGASWLQVVRSNLPPMLLRLALAILLAWAMSTYL